MKAKFVRGQDPKAAMNIGGFSLDDEYKSVEEAIVKYKDFAMKTLEGKTISIDQALILAYRTNTTIEDVGFQVKNISVDEFGDIEARGFLLGVSDDNLDTIEEEQDIRGFPHECNINIEKSSKIRILK